MLYFLLLLLSVVIVFSTSQIIKIPAYQGRIFHFFLQQYLVVTFLISLFAVITTQGKSFYLIFIPIYFYLIKNKYIVFIRSDKASWVKNSRYLLLIIPVAIVQFCLHVDFSDLTPFLPSDDILLYSSYANHLVQFKSENRYEALNVLYPQLFSGVSPYHFYEIWFTAFIGFISGKSYVFILLFIVYPYLVWLFVLSILSVFEHFVSKLTLKHYILAFFLLFIGPVYFQVYERVFQDGNFLPTTVFTITGFVKQTLAFSYYGQKHLPVYIIGVLSFLFLLKNHYSLFVLVLCCMAIISFGTLPGVYGALGGLILIKKEFRNLKNVVILSLMALAVVTIPNLFPLGINKEISTHTFYFNDFLKYLNIKGEILRVLAKFVCPAIWFVILYFPCLLILGFYRKNILGSKFFSLLFYFVIFSFLSGAGFISIVQGINSDQFLTNLLPIYNLIVVILFIYLFSVHTNKTLLTSGLTIILMINVYFIFNFHYSFHKKADEMYSLSVTDKIRNELNKEEKEPLIAYLLSDSVVNNYPPVIWYPSKPCKALFMDNYLNHININYPYNEYERNSASIAFGPYNQMRFYLKDSVVNKNDFYKYQISFLKEKNISWLFCGKGVVLDKALEKIVAESYYDPLSKEHYYRLK